jgi:hypothetical protein
MNIPKKNRGGKAPAAPHRTAGGFQVEEPGDGEAHPGSDLAFEDLFPSERERPAAAADAEEQEQPPPHLTHADEDDDEPDEEGSLSPTRSKMSLERLEQLKVVGQGAYGKVLQVRVRGTSEVYAMKVLRKDFLVKTRNVEYTKTEKNILKRVRHPFVVGLHYAFQSESKVYLVMDFVNGGQLFFHMREQVCPLPHPTLLPPR